MNIKIEQHRTNTDCVLVPVTEVCCTLVQLYVIPQL